MSVTYTITTNFGAKDALPTGDSSKVVRGSEFTTEFTSIQNAFALCAPSASPTFTGTATFDNVTVNGTLSGTNLSGTNTGDEPDASTTVKGIVELATQAEVDTGTDTVRAVTPSTLTNWSALNVTNWDAAYNDKINSASFNSGSGLLTLTQQDAGTVTVSLEGRYLTSYTETDTLASVTGRGATTSTACTFNGDVNFRANVDLADNDILRFGDSDDMEIRHDGTHNYIDLNNTGDLYVTNGTTNLWLFDRSTGDFHADGDLFASSTSVGSDERLKRDIEDIDGALSTVKKMRGVSFKWRKDMSEGTGVIAQEMLEVAPHLVKEVEQLNGTSRYTVNYNEMSGYFIEAIKELAEEQRKLKSQITKLKKELQEKS